MLATNSWIYLDLQKTGCTFIRKKLLEIFPNELYIEEKKHKIQSEYSDLPKIITIRDPYQYYFSLWCYGLDKKGAFYKRINIISKKLSAEMYKTPSQKSFSRFLDYVLHVPPSNVRSKHFWLPFSFDLYTRRILSMIIPISNRSSFLEEIGCDYQSPEILLKAAAPFIPEVLLRTNNLNSDFHRLANQGALDFLKLTDGWEKLFPINSKAENTSISIKKDRIDDYLLPGWKNIIKSKSSLSFMMLEKASSQFNF